MDMDILAYARCSQVSYRNRKTNGLSSISFLYPVYSVQGCRKTDGLSSNFLLKIMNNNLVQNTGYIYCAHPLAYSGQSPARYTRNKDHVFILPTDPRCYQHSTFSGFRLYFSGNGRTRSDCLLYGGTLSQIT